jgi:hypothetical protein
MGSQENYDQCDAQCERVVFANRYRLQGFQVRGSGKPVADDQRNPRYALASGGGTNFFAVSGVATSGVVTTEDLSCGCGWRHPISLASPSSPL